MKVNKEIVDKRRNDILNLIRREESVSIDNLCEVFKVSAATMQRDLNHWANYGLIQKKGGKALLTKNVENEKDIRPQNTISNIAMMAANYIKDNDVVFINASETALLTLEYVKAKNVTVITNNMNARKYVQNQSLNIIFCGGQIRILHNALLGDVTVNLLKSITANVSIVGCGGITTDEVKAGTLDVATVNMTMLEQTHGKKIIVCTSDKFESSHSFKFASLNEIDYLITDDKISQEYVDNIESKHHTQIIQVPFDN